MNRIAWALPAVVIAALAVGCGAKTAKNQGPNDYDGGSWVPDPPLYTSAGNIIVEPALAFTADGTGVGVWSVYDQPADLTDGDLEVDLLENGTWTSSRLTNDTAVQYSTPALATDGNAMAMAYTRYVEGSGEGGDVWLTANDGSWSSPQNLTTAIEAASATNDDYRNALAVGPGGEKAIAYVSNLTGPPEGPTEIRVLKVGGSPETAIPNQGGLCDQPSIVFDADGVLHVLADCVTGAGDDSIFYASNSAGGWAAAALPGTTGSNFSARLVLGPDGHTLHATWIGVRTCSGSGGSCFEPYYARKDPGQAWTQPQFVAGTGNDSEYQPDIAVDGDGAVLIAYARDDSAGNADIFLKWSPDGHLFSDERNLTGSPENDGEPRLAVDPVSGRPHLLYVHHNDSVVHAAWTR
jgi:hypothetical protein